MLLYSASIEDFAAIFLYFFIFQEIRDDPLNKQNPVKDLAES